MRLKPDQIPQHLNGGLKPIYLVTGEEPLLSQEAIDLIRARAREEGYEERQVFNVERGFDWQSLIDEASALSLFANKRIIELKLPTGKPGTEGSKKLSEYLAKPPEETLLIIDAGRIDKKTLDGSKWCKAIDDAGIICQIWPIKPQEMLGFMRQRAKRLKLDIAYDALELLSSRLEGNLLAAKQELDKLSMLHGKKSISVGMIFDEVKDSARYDVFDLSGAMLNGDVRAATNILRHLEAEGTEATYLIWAIAKDIRLLCGLIPLIAKHQNTDHFFKQNRIFKQQQSPYLRAARRIGFQQAHDALKIIKRSDDAAKGKRYESAPGLLIETAILMICGHNILA